MKIPKYLSPTSIKMWKADRQQFYLRYLADHRGPSDPQTQAMSIGSAFDAFAKAHIYKTLNGHSGHPYKHNVKNEDGTIEIIQAPEFELETLFKAQVEPQHREWAHKHGERLFRLYCEYGALANLMRELSLASSTPRFEFFVNEKLKFADEIEGVPLLGKPDIFFYIDGDNCVTLDWKVNGYCSKSAKSPEPGYVRCIDLWSGKQSRSHGQQHKDAMVSMWHKMFININHMLEDINYDWAVQCTIYSWLMGAKIGGDFVIGIEQLCSGGNDGMMEYPQIRCASYRSKPSVEFQERLFGEIAFIWNKIRLGPEAIFDDSMGPAESEALCNQLDTLFAVNTDDFMFRMTRG